jgi:molybdate transport system permease protein
MTLPEIIQFSSNDWQAIQLTLWIALRAIAIGLPIAIGVAWVLSHLRFPGRIVLDLVAHLPLVLPPVVVGYLLLVGFGKNGPIGRLLANWFDISFAFSAAGASLATGVMAFPLMVRAIRLSMEAIPHDYEEAARDLGAGRWHVFRTITLPLSQPGILSGAIVAFAAALGEFGAVITFVSNIPGETQTLPLAIYSALQTPDGDAAALRLASVSITLAVIGLALSEMINRRIARQQGRKAAAF